VTRKEWAQFWFAVLGWMLLVAGTIWAAVTL
jgi:hypothetical protein